MKPTLLTVCFAITLGLLPGDSGAAVAGDGPGQFDLESIGDYDLAPDQSSGGTGDAYEAGMEALDKGSWARAVKIFGDLADSDSSRADGALYWLAFAENKRGRPSAALEAIARLERDFSGSRWVVDAKALQVEIRGSTGQEVALAESDEELRLIALNALLNAKPERAIPRLEKILATSTSADLRTQALFILTQSGSPRAAEIVRSYALGQGDPELQIIAVNYLGIEGDAASIATLREIYEASDSQEVKTAVLSGYMIAHASDELLAAVRTESDPELRQAAIHQLGLTDAASQLWGLYAAESDYETKSAILHALFLSDDVDKMIEVARNEPDEELRMVAIRHLGLSDRSDLLGELFRTETSPELRQVILHALSLAGDTATVLEVARSDSDPEMRSLAIHQLGVMGGDEARSTLRKLYHEEEDPELRAAVLHTFMISDDTEFLIEIARTETDRELRRMAVHQLSMMESEEALAYLESLLE